ncbi:hybrid sensor histidine kinase/response regulator [Roseisolibacter agri]|uniref:hybrid sensor histidine kinase/response regulator n=1 Tax=Roseisolibacter agri TaxID=2014610 RepID=UPI0024E1882B|nr:ATP-binding protein [Roseisolibacter agri]
MTNRRPAGDDGAPANVHGDEDRRLALLVEHAFDLVAIVDASQRLVYASPAHARVLGYTAADLAAMDLRALIHDEDVEYLAGLREAVVRDGSAGPSRPVRVRSKRGGWCRLQLRITDLRHEPAIGGFVVNARDVTEHLAVEEQLQQAQRLDAIGRLAGGVAHDFNNLLTVITGYTSMLLAQVPPEDPNHADLVEVKGAADRAAELTQQILMFSRRQALTPQVVDTRRVIGEMRRMLERLIGEHIEFVVSEGAAPVHALVDRVQLEQVVMNLVVNARDAMPSGGRLTIEVDVVAVPAGARGRHPSVAPGEYARIRVRDTGCGMDERTMAHMFEPFYTTKEPGKGTGLGLSTVYRIVRQSGGVVWADSVPSEGATFSVLLPGATVATRDVARAREVPPAPAPEGATVLLVEDEAIVRALAERVLRRQGCRVLSARNGVEALAVARWHDGPIDLLVTDVVMPAMSGTELAERFGELRRDVPVLFMTGYAIDHVTGRDGARPETRLLSKPFSPHELSVAVSGLLGTSAARR